MMIKSYNKPEMKITFFQSENVATTASTETVGSPKTTVGGSDGTSYGKVRSDVFGFNN